jgi:hypothetical protein
MHYVIYNAGELIAIITLVNFLANRLCSNLELVPQSGILGLSTADGAADPPASLIALSIAFRVAPSHTGF